MPYELQLFSVNDKVGSIVALHGLPLNGKQEWKKRKFTKNRRKRRLDRRREVRSGVIVSLSSSNNRRKKKDRRQVL